MASKLLTSNIWKELTASAKRHCKNSFAAVAYFGKGASKMLPLKKGSSLVVDASEHSVKSGQTSPTELLQLYKQGVKIYSYSNLHAKVFVFGNDLFIGSTNVSSRSSNLLQEAVFKTSDRKSIRESKKFIEQLCGIELGPAQLKALNKIYRPPKIAGGKGVKAINPKKNVSLPGFYICLLETREFSKGHEEPLKQGRVEAKKMRINIRRHQVEEFEWTGTFRAKKGDIVMQIVHEPGKEMVSPPGVIINIKSWGNYKKSFVFVEVPVKRRKNLTWFSKRIESRVLNRSGKKDSVIAHKIIELWK